MAGFNEEDWMELAKRSESAGADALEVVSFDLILANPLTTLMSHSDFFAI